MTGTSTGDSIDEALGRLADLRAREQTSQIEAQIPDITNALASAGVDAIVLKGPSTRMRLYGDDETRPVSDIDLLVDPMRFKLAATSLTGRGYQRVDRHGHSDTYRHPAPDLADIDLHLTLPYVRVRPSRLFDALSTRTVTLGAPGRSIRILDQPAHAMHLAIHAAVNFFDPTSRSIDEWRRAHAALDETGRTRARDLADTLEIPDVWRLAIRALEDGEDLSVLAAERPTWEVEPRWASIKGAARSGVPLSVRRRDLQRLAALQLGDEALNAWRSDRGESPVVPGTPAAAWSRMYRLADVTAKGALRFTRRAQRSSRSMA